MILKSNKKWRIILKKIVLVLSTVALIFNFIEAQRYKIQWGIGLRNFDLDTLFGIGILALISYLLLMIFKVKSRKTTALILGSFYGVYKAIKLYSLSNGMFGLVSLFFANHTMTITLAIIIISSMLSIFSRKKESKIGEEVESN